MVQFHVDADVGFVVLRVIPACINHLVGVRRGIQRAVTEAVIDPVMPVIGEPVPQAVAPVDAVTIVTNVGLWRRESGGRRFWACLLCLVTTERDDDVVGEGVIGEV